MGFDTMAAWDKSSITSETSSINGFEYPPTSPLAYSRPTSSYELQYPPGFQQTTSHWSPPLSPTTSRPPSRHTTPPQSPRADSAMHASSILHPKDKSALASQLYTAACTGDLAQINLVHSRGAFLNAGTVVQHLYEAFKPAKHGHLTPLAGAASHGQLAAARLLLALGADINPDLTQSSSAPLHQACMANDTDMTRFLLANGACLNAQNCYRTTPLMYAIKYGSPSLIALLLSRKPDLRLVSLMGTSAIHWAILQNTRPVRVEVLGLLLRAGADVDHRMSDENSPLHCAAMGGLDNVVEFLLGAGADAGARNAEWKTPAEVAAGNGFFWTAKLLRRWGG